MKINKKKLKVTAYILALVLLTGLFYSFWCACSYYYTHHYFYWQNPVYIQTPLRIVPKYTIDKDKTMYNGEQETIKETETVEKIDNDVFFGIVWKYESNEGKDTTPNALHMKCRKQGKWNEIGYNPQQTQCFGDMLEAKLFVNYWLKKNCDGKSMNACLCYYNGAGFTDNCSYAKGQLSLAN